MNLTMLLAIVFTSLSSFVGICYFLFLKRELYPSLLLFRAVSKNAIPYEGDMAVPDVVQFIFNDGSNPPTIVKEEGETLSSLSFSS